MENKLNKLFEEITGKVGDYATAEKISKGFNLSLSYVYVVVKNNKIASRKRYGRNEYSVKDFLALLDFGFNVNVIKNALTKEENDINNFFNLEYQTPIEEFIMTYLLENVGEFCNVRDLVEIFKLSKNSWYEIIDAKKLITLNIGVRKLILTRSLLPFLRDALAEKE